MQRSNLHRYVCTPSRLMALFAVQSPAAAPTVRRRPDAAIRAPSARNPSVYGRSPTDVRKSEVRTNGRPAFDPTVEGCAESVSVSGETRVSS